ncbi:MAG TPA: hypothetical protein VJL59_20725, partial [Anaerolineales bacterium]|nr:hypothetical protein [Anaerolineales bacterium]
AVAIIVGCGTTYRRFVRAFIAIVDSTTNRNRDGVIGVHHTYADSNSISNGYGDTQTHSDADGLTDAYTHAARLLAIPGVFTLHTG